MTKLHFMVEEESMAIFLKGLLPRLIDTEKFSHRIDFYDGVNDLIKKASKTIDTYETPDTLIIVLLDKDNADCKERKMEILAGCPNHKCPLLVRIVCYELESWYLGDKPALCQVYPDFKKFMNKKNFRGDPDSIEKPSRLLEGLSGFRKTRCAKEMAKHMDIDHNSSASFKAFRTGLDKLLTCY